MPTARVVALAREMKEGSTRMDEPNGKDLAAVTPQEFKEANPNGYALLVSEVTAQSDAKICEMQEQVDAAAEDKRLIEELRSVLKLKPEDNLLEKIGSMVEKLGVKAKEVVDSTLDELLGEKVKDEGRRRLVRGLLEGRRPAMEMAAGEKADAESAKTVVREMVEQAFNEDDLIKEQVSEMSPPLPRRHEQFHGTKPDYAALGVEKTTRKVGA
jgi:hypothetical protein